MRAFLLSIGLAVSLALPTAAMDAPGGCREESERFVSRGGGCLDLDSGIAWGMPPLQPMNFKEAAAFCASLVQSEVTGWRLPAKRALMGLAKKRMPGTLAFSERDFFWAEDSGNSPDAWTVNLENGDPSYESKVNFQGRALCVRQEFGCSREDERFKTEFGGCHDTLTGRVWSNVAASAMNWLDAHRHCSSLKQGGFQTWRLPSRDEVAAISGPDEARTHFPVVPQLYLWIVLSESSPDSYNAGLMPVASLLDSGFNQTPGGHLYYSLAEKTVLCVRKK